MFITILIAAGVAINVLSIASVVYRLARLRKPAQHREAAATLILPLTGEARTLPRLIEALNAQTLPPRRLIVAVEAQDDPAHAAALAASGRAAFPVEVAVAGRASRQAQKCRNQQAALALIDGRDEAIVLLDGDIMPQDWWLSALVSPLGGQADLVSGHRWQQVSAPRLGAHLVAMIDRAVTLCPRFDWAFAHVVWGGSVAVSRRAADAIGLERCFDGTLSDDLSLSERAAGAGFRLLTRGALLVPTPNGHDLVSAWHFARRQYQIIHIYRPWLWRLALATIGLRLAVWAAVLYGIAWLWWAALLLAGLAVVKQLLTFRIADRLDMGDPASVRAGQLALAVLQPLADLFHLSVILAAAATGRVTWGHVVYRVAGPYAVSVEERRPFTG